jgi:hypothetical protein
MAQRGLKNGCVAGLEGALRFESHITSRQRGAHKRVVLISNEKEGKPSKVAHPHPRAELPSETDPINQFSTIARCNLLFSLVGRRRNTQPASKNKNNNNMQNITPWAPRAYFGWAALAFPDHCRTSWDDGSKQPSYPNDHTYSCYTCH